MFYLSRFQKRQNPRQSIQRSALPEAVFRRSKWLSRGIQFVLGCSLSVLLSLVWLNVATPAQGQSPAGQIPAGQSPAEQSPAEQSPSPDAAPAVIEPAPANIALPDPMPAAPTLAAAEPGQYALEFNRSPVVGNRFRFEGIYDEARLHFTRPRNWELKSVKVLLRYRHSPALYATRSNMTVLINGTSVGSVPLNQQQNKIGSTLFEVPVELLQNHNELVVAALQNNSPTCTQDPYDPSLWSEVLPDSKILFDFQPQPVSLDFSRYPFPIFDDLSLEANRIAYLQPKTAEESWMTAATRLHTSLGRLAAYRPLENRLVRSLDEVTPEEHLVIVGTPTAQPAIATLNLPLALEGDRLLDGEGKPIPNDVGVLILTTAQENQLPVLIATGNTSAGVSKAAQFLVRSQGQQLSSGQAIFVTQLPSEEVPPLRQWPGYLPLENQFKLSDLRTDGDQPYGDVTVRGSHAPAIEVNFRAMPDDRFLPGNTLTLNYSYGPQINPLTSMIEVQLDGVAIGGERLTSVQGANRETLQVKLPEDWIKSHSKLQVNFRLDPRERRSCSRVTDQQLWGTIHADSQFSLQRETVTKLPNLKLLTTGFPFTAPQDLSNAAIVLPQNPSANDLELMLEVGERLGRLSKAESVQVSVYRANKLPAEQRDQAQLIVIGDRDRFPFPEVLQSTQGFALKQQAVRQWQQKQVQILNDAEGVVKQVLSPWNDNRVLLILSGQTPKGLAQVQTLFAADTLFYQLQGDTALISAHQAQPSPLEPNDFNLKFLQETTPRSIALSNSPGQFLSQMRNSWMVLAPAFVVAALLLYGVVQLLLNRFSNAS